MSRSKITNNTPEIEIAHKVAIEGERIAKKFDILGRLALLHVITSEVNPRDVLEKLQHFRGKWTGLTKESSCRRYYAKNRYITKEP